MEIILLAEKRETRPKGLINRLRKEGKIPAIVCAPHAVSIPIAISAYDFNQAFHTVSENTIISLKIGKTSRDVLIKDFFRHPISGDVRHIDFLEVRQDEKLRTHVPLEVHGNPVGVREGGILERRLSDIEVECFPRDLPENIRIDISTLAIGDSLHVSDLAMQEGVKVLTDVENLIVLVSAPKTAEEEEVEEDILLEEDPEAEKE